jgi:hypothetical protein
MAWCYSASLQALPQKVLAYFQNWLVGIEMIALVQVFQSSKVQ